MSNTLLPPEDTVPESRGEARGVWMRGLGLGIIHAVMRTGLAYAVTYWTPWTSFARWVSLAAVVAIAAAWGLSDGRRNARAEGKRVRDLTMFWLAASAIAGVTSGGLVALISAVVTIRSDSTSILFELTTGAAWVLLVTYVPAMVGAAIARRLIGRRELLLR